MNIGGLRIRPLIDTPGSLEFLWSTGRFVVIWHVNKRESGYPGAGLRFYRCNWAK
ncbi:hypothetical protein LCGC14_0611860 [marine sediment metagenome]|uniref:Uncharacterized protein n=1 Tax=marine sediment metagenome TaxID=412755 RepID=A0A0F9RRN7_9ZZZZ